MLGVIFGITNTFRPFPDDVFRYGQGSLLLPWSLNKVVFVQVENHFFIMEAILSCEKYIVIFLWNLNHFLNCN